MSHARVRYRAKRRVKLFLANDLGGVWHPCIRVRYEQVTITKTTYGTASRYSIFGKRLRNSCSRPIMTVMIELGQALQSVPNRRRTTPAWISRTSIPAGSNAKAGATSSRKTRVTRFFKSALSSGRVIFLPYALIGSCQPARLFDIEANLIDQLIR